eukprot:5365986-Pleurochrysis_carterae.AAC.2
MTNAKQINLDIGKIDELLDLLHMSQIQRPTAAGAATRTRLIENRMELKKQLSAPKPHTSYFVYKKSELMSRQFWQATFPKATKTFNGILKLCTVSDWSNPPPKNIDTGQYTTDSITNEAAKYYSHLYAKPHTGDNEAASKKLFKILQDGNVVDYSTSKIAGQPIQIPEISATMSNLPDSKSPGPDRIPNEFYKTFAKMLAPLYSDYYNSLKKQGLPKGFSDGSISILYKKGIKEDIRNSRPITLRKRLLIDARGAALVRTALRRLRFHDSYCKWIDLLYDDNNGPKRLIIAHGYLSKPFRITQGTAQGCPLSPLLFLIIVEFLVIVEGFTQRSVQQDRRIKGIGIGEMHSKIRHFADDTIGTLRNEDELEYFQEHINTFCTATDMLKNASKRDMLPLGRTSNIDPSQRKTTPVTDPDSGLPHTPNWVENNNTLFH